MVRESLKKSQIEASDKNKVISELKKSLKAKDKEIYNVEKNYNIATDTNNQLRDQITELKRDQSEAAKTLKNTVKQGSIGKEKLEQKVKALEKKVKSVESESNNNNTAKHVHSSPSVSAATSSVLHTSTFPAPPSSNSIISLATTTSTKSLPICLATTKVYSHPDAEPSSSAVSQPSSMKISCTALFSPRPNSMSISPHTPQGTPPPCSAPLTTTPSGSSTSPARTTPPAHLCQHTPQCVARQPRPPPPEKCSILVHMGSKYHE